MLCELCAPDGIPKEEGEYVEGNLHRCLTHWEVWDPKTETWIPSIWYRWSHGG